MSDTLTQGQKLVRGESLVSDNGAYTLTLQEDGNLVLSSRPGLGLELDEAALKRYAFDG